MIVREDPCVLQGLEGAARNVGSGGCLEGGPGSRPKKTTKQQLLNDIDLEEGGCRQEQVGFTWHLAPVLRGRLDS